MKILIAGYPYVREEFLKTFDNIVGECIFLLPKRWKAKGGAVVFRPPVRANVVTTDALFYHSNYPFVGGILKGWMPAFPFWCWKLRNEIDIVYTPLEPILLSALYQSFLAKAFGKKHIFFTWENIPYDKFHGLNKVIKLAILKLNIFFSDGIVCGNHKAEEIIKKYTDKPTVVIPLSGVDTDFFIPIPKDQETVNKYGLEGKFIFSFIGALGYRKGIHLIIDSIKKLVREHSNIRLIMVGSGEYGKELKKMIGESDLSSYVIEIPWADARTIKKILSVSDVFLYPSLPYGGWEEQFGYSIAEAMAMGIPVISTNSGSIGELIETSKNGILVEPNDISGLSGAMEMLIDKESLRSDVGKNARQYIVDTYSRRIVENKYSHFFHSYDRK